MVLWKIRETVTRKVENSVKPDANESDRPRTMSAAGRYGFEHEIIAEVELSLVITQFAVILDFVNHPSR
jgi:hypothetical protein